MQNRGREPADAIVNFELVRQTIQGDRGRRFFDKGDRRIRWLPRAVLQLSGYL